MNAAAVLSTTPLPAGRRVGVITNAGGLGILCADACESAGLELTELTEATRAALAAEVPGEASLANPVDLLGSATAKTYEAVVGPVLSDPNIDALIVLFVPPVVAGAEEVAAAIRRAVESAAQPKPVIAVVVSAAGVPAVLRESDSPVAALSYPESAARALALAVERAEWLARPEGVVTEVDGIDLATGRALVVQALETGDDVWLDPDTTWSLLEAYGIPVVRERTAESVDEAVEAAAALGFPGRREDGRSRRPQGRCRRRRARPS